MKLKQIIGAPIVSVLLFGSIGELAINSSTVFAQSTTNNFPVPKHQGLCHNSIDPAIDKLVENAVVKNKIPGLTVSVSKNGRMVCNKSYGYANWDKKTPMTPRSRSQIGSVSKVIVTAGMMKLLEQGQVSLQTPIYGNNGILKGTAYQKAMRQGTRRYRPIIDTLMLL